MEHVTFVRDIQETLSSFPFDRYSSIFVLCDNNTDELCYPLISNFLPEHTKLVVAPGEESKNLDTAGQIWQFLTDHACDRKGLVINLGGGVLCDMGGFCASTYKRGISFVNLPTTVLAQVDASVGGKLGIDFNGFKNHIGLFKEPEAVFIYVPFIDTLPEEEKRSGYAEIMKHALIWDKDEWQKIRTTSFQDIDWEARIKRSVEIKHEVASSDPNEFGLRKILNFGHTIGHAVETWSILHNRRILHGYAVAYGMKKEAMLSEVECGLPESKRKELEETIDQVYPEFHLSDGDINEVMAYMKQDKKNEKGKILFSLIKNTGEAVYNIDIAPDQIRKVLN